MSNRAWKRVVIASALAFVAAPPATAQLVNGKWQAPAKSGGTAAAAPRQGTEVRRDAGAATASNGTIGTVVPVRVIHAVLMSDGSVMADFGAGLELVQRACPQSMLQSPLRIIGAPPGTQPQPAPGLQPAPGMQPAPALQTESQKMLPSAQQVAAAHSAAQASCHLRDQQGHTFAVR